jgi:hypothetical protein
MTIARHWCFDGSGHRLGSYLDCPQCWDALEQSVELAVSEGTSTGDTPPAETSREVSRPGVPAPYAWARHDTRADTEPSADDEAEGGRWVVSCTCGWSQAGHYARDTGEPVALRLARLVGRKHEEYPEDTA